jgi:hypothetical protein
VVVKQLFAGVIFIAIALIAFSRVAPTGDGRPPLEHLVHDLLAEIHLR